MSANCAAKRWFPAVIFAAVPPPLTDTASFRTSNIASGPCRSAADAPLSCFAADRPPHPSSGIRRHAAHPALARHGELGARAQLAFRDLGRA
jgi:hypothetical protein